MKILYPPRPQSKLHPNQMLQYEKTGLWVWQRKFNGTHVAVNVSTDRKVGILTSHGSAPKLFSLTKRHVDDFLSITVPGKEYWFAGELLDHKTSDKRYKGKIVLFDVLQAGHYFMRNPDQLGRLRILNNICGHPTELESANGIALKVTDNIWMAEIWDTNIEDRFRDFLHLDEIEGLVLRRKNSCLNNFGNKEYEVPWMIRCRKPHKNYTF